MIMLTKNFLTDNVKIIFLKENFLELVIVLDEIFVCISFMQ